MSGPIPAVGSFPYPHRTIEQVDADVLAARREAMVKALRKAEAERVGRVHAKIIARHVVRPTERLR